ncbi:MAG: cysteine peptidase family C39 domain-containing protein [Verrucomicrobiota bacterium]|nr:cysteine peptidase family C39 domain-containing protein [Verrucomicrobiota bacterium]
MSKFIRRYPSVLKFLLVVAVLTGSILYLRARNDAEELQALKRTKFFNTRLKPIHENHTREESSLLLDLLMEWRRTDSDESLVQLVQFADALPNSAWTPHLNALLGHHFFEQGRYTPALRHWEIAWEQTKEYREGNGKEVGDFALAFYIRLLSMLGRTEQLGEIFEELKGRSWNGGWEQQMVLRAHEGFLMMRARPGLSYQCGTFALNNLATVLYGNHDRKAILDTPSPVTGFSVLMLVEMAQTLRMSIVAVDRGEDTEIVVPSVVHWKQNHYAAITKRVGDLYEVIDPTFQHPRFIPRKIINEEASGVFLVSSEQVPEQWKILSDAEAGQVFGRGYPNFMPDDDDCDGCCPNGGGGGGGGGGGRKGGHGGAGGHGGNGGDGGSGSGGGCDLCYLEEGMARWRVSEPQINLWIQDQPLAYQPAYGPPVILDVSFKQRTTASPPADYSFGNGVSCRWRSLIDVRYGVLYSGDGRIRDLNLTSGEVMDYYTNQKIKITQYDGNGEPIVYEIISADGSKLIYNFLETNSWGYWTIVHLGKIVDAAGHSVTLEYNNGMYDPDIGDVKLTAVIDAEGNRTELFYNTTYPNLVDHVTDPGNRTAYFSYNSNGQLTGITDVEGITSSLTYDGNGWPDSLTTPYGTTSFTSTYGDPLVNPIDREIVITHPDLSREVYVFIWDFSGHISGPYGSNEVPAGTPLDSFDNSPSRLNSFFWNRKQAEGLPSDLDLLTTSDFLKSRMKHWLGGAGTISARLAVSTLAILRDPSPDGVIEGQKTWFDHAGKLLDDAQGPQIKPSVVARVMPDSTTWYTYYQYNSYGHVTNQIEKWVSGGTAYYRTNTFLYSADGLDLIEHRGPENKLVAGYGYNVAHPHQPTTITNALGEVTVNSYDSLDRISTILQPSGLLSTYTYGVDEYVSKVVESVGGTALRTNQFTWSNGVMATQTDERGLTQTFTYDGLRRLKKIEFPDLTSIEHRYTNAAGTMLLDRTATKDRLGNWDYTVYNAWRQPLLQIDSLNRTNAFGYCSCGALSSVTNAFNTPVQTVTSYI